tara:strand:- start:338 stop:1090 length:753 start_codon:yes stop_codon:yes gene_type:complete
MAFTATEEMVQDLKRDGFTVVRSAFDEATVSKLEQELERLSHVLTAKRDIHFVGPNKDVLSSLHNMHEHSEFWCDLVRGSGLIDLVRMCYGTVDPKVFNGSFFAKPARYGLATAAHQDNAYNYIKGGEILTLWIAVDNANPENGGLYYYPGSHNLGDVDHLPEGNLGASMAVTKPMIEQLNLGEPVMLDLKRGDCVIHNALVIHGSEDNLSERERRGCNFSIASQAEWDKEAFARYEKKLAAFLDAKKSH